MDNWSDSDRSYQSPIQIPMDSSNSVTPYQSQISILLDLSDSDKSHHSPIQIMKNSCTSDTIFPGQQI